MMRADPRMVISAVRKTDLFQEREPFDAARPVASGRVAYRSAETAFGGGRGRDRRPEGEDDEVGFVRVGRSVGLGDKPLFDSRRA